MTNDLKKIYDEYARPMRDMDKDDVIRTSKLPYKKLENIYNIKGRQIYRIKKRIQWKHVI